MKCRWARACRCSMPPQETAGICWAGGRSTQPLSAIWNSEALSQNLYKNNYRKITKSYCKSLSKELQYGYRKGKTLLDHEIFFFLFFGISGVRHPPPAVLLHSCRPTPHRRYSASCAKEPVWFRTGFLRPKIRRNRPTAKESMTLGQFACFSAKDIYKVWRGRGLYSAWVCGKVYTINS